MCGLILCRAPPHPPPCVHKSEGKSNRVHCYSMEQAYIGQLPQCIKDSLLATESVSTSGAAISTASTTFAGSTISLSPFLSLYLTLPIFWNVLLLFLTWFSSFLSSILLLIADPPKAQKLAFRSSPLRAQEIHVGLSCPGFPASDTLSQGQLLAPYSTDLQLQADISHYTTCILLF